MKKITGFITVLLLGVVFIFSVSTVISRCVEIQKTENEIKDTQQSIEKQKIENAELSDVLSEENRDDFYRNLAEELGYGYAEEKIYIDMTGY